MSEIPNGHNEANYGDTPDREVYQSPKEGIVGRIFDVLFKNRAGMYTALFTGVLSLFTYLLWNVSRSTDETSRVSQRAFVNFNGLQVGVNLANNEQKEWVGQEFTLNWINSGNTPASRVDIRTKAQTWRSDLPADYDFPTEKIANSPTIGPKLVYGTNVQITKNDILDAWHGNSKLFFWGTVVYRDIFFPTDPDHVTEFCIQPVHIVFQTPFPDFTKPITPNFAGVVAMQWQECPQHNCYDDDCRDYHDRVKEARSSP
jgi:hypothetical protein